MEPASSTTTQSQMPQPNDSVFGCALGYGAYALLVTAIGLVVWACCEGIVLPPVKRSVHPISLIGVPAAVVCVLFADTWLDARRMLRSGRFGAAIGYVTLIPLALLIVAGALALVVWFNY